MSNMKIKIGVMGSAGDTLPEAAAEGLREKAEALGRAIAARDVVLLTGATTGATYMVGRAAREAGAFHIGVSPAENVREHVEGFRLPTDACDAIIYTGFGLKGRNVVLVRSCDIVLFISGSMGTLNEFTIAHDEGRVIGCLTKTGGVADEAERLMEIFSKHTRSVVLHGDDPIRLVNACIEALHQMEEE
ncbi:MAG: LOG family protein [Pyrinomonadaceae bacterium]|nr:LOG family protein [Pyrinomonadaceae bacterium]